MGRSQVKYRATHGRGRGRGDAGGGRGGASGRGRPFHLRNLGSNAFRFEEREAEEADQEAAQTQGDYGGRTQFFASEQNYREQMGAAPGEHFQSRTMKQWEDKDDAADDQGAVGVLDLDWIASQLEIVSPDIRYRIDPKYCTDFPFEPQEEDGSESEKEVVQETTSIEAAAGSGAAPPATSSKAVAQGDSELDFLLNLSASTSSGVKSTPTPSIPAAPRPAPTRTPAETEQLEEWLDDVLDM